MNKQAPISTRLQDPIAALFWRLHGELTVELLRVERNPTQAAVHGARVATRRLRSLLRAFRRHLHPVLYAGVQFDLRNLARTLGPLRDASIRRMLVRALRHAPVVEVDGECDEALKRLHGRLVEEERSLQSTVRLLVRAPAWTERTRRIDDALSNPALIGATRVAPDQLARQALRRRIRRVVNRLAPNKTTQRPLHRLRLAVKQARYLAGVLTGVLDASGDPLHGRQLRRLHRLQTSLGDLNDHFALHGWLMGAGLDPWERRALVREVDLRIEVRIQRFKRLRKQVRRQFEVGAAAAASGSPIA